MNNEQSLSHTKWECKVVGFIKGKSAIHIARQYSGRKKNFTEQHFWARGYHSSTVGRDEEVIRKYIKEQEREDRRIDQMNFFRQIAATF
jgi:putative transposase